MNNIPKLFTAVISILLLITAAAIFACSSVQPVISDNVKGCTHCHGENLEGVKFVNTRCGECHELDPISPDRVSSEETKKSVTEPPHPHKVKNLFSQTPSCFVCHRKTDFNGEKQ